MDFSSINWLAVIVCVIVSMISGSLWYNPKTFFPIWWKGIGKENQAPGMQNMGMTWTLTILASFVQATAMAFMVNSMGKLMGGPSLVTGHLQGLCCGLALLRRPIWSINYSQVTA